MKPLAATTGRALWRNRVEATPERAFLLDGDDAFTFAQADDAMRRVASGLRTLGVAAGTRVVVGMPNGAEAFWVHAALRELGAVIVPLVPGLTLPELAYQIAHCEATVVIVAEPVASALLPRLAEFPKVRTAVLAGAAAAPDSVIPAATIADLLTLDPIAPADDGGLTDRSPWAIFYTSGSTGRPKGVVLPSGAFVSAGWGYAERFAVTAEDNYVVATPMAHAVGGLTEPSGAIHTGCRLTILERFRPSRFWSEVARAEGTVTILFPAQLNLLLALESDGPPSGDTPLRLVISHVYQEAFVRRFGVAVGVCWGMTETGATSTGSTPGYRGERGTGYVGRGMEGVEVAILDEFQRTLPPGAEGEICLRHRHQMLGYLNDEDATREALAAGWVRSGDRGHLDENGHLYFAGRTKNMIKRAGENLSPEEIEAAIDAHGAVAESIVLGVPDPVRTEEAAAVVVLREGHDLASAELVAFLTRSLARWKVPRYIALRTQPLPRLSNGKLDRRSIRADLDLTACWDREAHRVSKVDGA